MKAFLLAAASFALITGSVQAGKPVTVETLMCFVPGSSTLKPISNASVVLCYDSGVREDKYCNTDQHGHGTTQSSAIAACQKAFPNATAVIPPGIDCSLGSYNPSVWKYQLCMQTAHGN